ncbi:MAG: glycosyltransferase family A protein [Solirubrobacteraceae bacterium]
MPTVPDTPIASIIVPTLTAARYLDVTLATVMPQAAAVGAEVIVVCDGPDLATTEVADRHGAQLISFRHQRGLNCGRNAGIKTARSDLLVFIDQDVRAPAGWLDALLAGMAAHPELEVFGGPIRAVLEGGPRGCGHEPPPITTLDAGPEDCDVPFVWGANMAMRRSAFDRIGLFDERLRGRGDEEDWELRWRAAGGRIRYLAAAGLDHRRTAEDSRLLVLARAAYGQGREARRHDVRVGKARAILRESRVLAGCTWHTVVRRCGYGIVMGARSAGSLREALTEHRS